MLTRGFLIAIFGSLTLLFLTNCKQTKNHPNPPSSNMNIDTSVISEVRNKINTNIDSLHAEIGRNPIQHKTTLEIDGVADTVEYWFTHDNSARISWSYSIEEKDRWPTVFLHKGELIKVRYREFNRIPPDTFAIELNLYYDKGVLHNQEYRKASLENNLAPYAVRRLPYRDTFISQTELDNWFYFMVDKILAGVEDKTIDLTQDQ